MLPKNRPPTHPGEMLLKEFLEPSGITQLELARHLRWTYARFCTSLGRCAWHWAGILVESSERLEPLAQHAYT
jgi:hypothetical protein